MTPDELKAIRERDSYLHCNYTVDKHELVERDRSALLAHVDELESLLEAVKEECADLIAGKEYQAMQRSLAKCNARLADMEARLAAQGRDVCDFDYPAGSAPCMCYFSTAEKRGPDPIGECDYHANLRKRLAACERDAERYRYLREENHAFDWDGFPWPKGFTWDDGVDMCVNLDRAIDIAVAADNSGAGP